MKKSYFMRLFMFLLCFSTPLLVQSQSMSNSFAEKATVVLLMDNDCDASATKGTQILIELVPAQDKQGQSKVSIKVLNLATKQWIENVEAIFVYKDDININKSGITFLKDNWYVSIEPNKKFLDFYLKNRETGIKKVYAITDVAFYERYSDWSMFNDFRYDSSMERSFEYLMTFFKKAQPNRRLY